MVELSIELIIQSTEDLDWKQCEQSNMWRTTDGTHAYWLDALDGGYYIELIDDPDYADRWFKHHYEVIQYIKRFSDPYIVLNSSKCTICGTVLKSLYRHDYVSCKCVGDSFIAIDGGNAYKRIIGSLKHCEKLDVFSNQHHGIIRESLHRSGYGKDGKQPLTWTVMKDMSDKYLDNLIEYMEVVDHHNNPYYSMYLTEKDYRKKHSIYIKE
jgi:hypothetical protein